MVIGTHIQGKRAVIVAIDFYALYLRHLVGGVNWLRSILSGFLTAWHCKRPAILFSESSWEMKKMSCDVFYLRQGNVDRNYVNHVPQTSRARIRRGSQSQRALDQILVRESDVLPLSA